MNCPSEFIVSPNGSGTCILPCPTQKNYELRLGTSGLLSCVYAGDSSISVSVLPVPAVQEMGPPFSYESLPNASVYQAEIERFSTAFAIADANVDRAVKVKTAYEKLQLAENARDQSPDAYQQARISYYTLIKGDTWVNDEKARIARVEAQPVIDQISSKNQDLETRIQQQKSTIEVVNGVKDKVLSVGDDLQYSVSAFQKQIKAIRNQMNMDKKKQVETARQAGSWVDSLLNWLIALATLVAIVFLIRYMMRPKTAFSTPSSTLPTS